MVVTDEMASNQSKYIPNWKAPGRDGVRGYWIKKLNSQHGRLVGQLNEILNGDKQLPEWMTYGRTLLCHMSSTQVAVCHHSKSHSIVLLNDHVGSSVSLSSTPVPHPYQVPSNWGYIYFDWIIPGSGFHIMGSRGTKDQLIVDKAVRIKRLQETENEPCNGLDLQS